jgi:hypothetical protein
MTVGFSSFGHNRNRYHTSFFRRVVKPNAPGRASCWRLHFSKQSNVMADYAHTTDGVASLLHRRKIGAGGYGVVHEVFSEYGKDADLWEAL